MSKNYAIGKPLGNNQVPFYDSPSPVIALASATRATAPTSSILILNSGTTAIEVLAGGAPVYLKWLTQAIVDSSVAGTSVISGSGANFDGMVAANTVRRFVIPIATVVAPPASYGVPQGANKDNNLYSHVATIGATTSVISIIQN